VVLLAWRARIEKLIVYDFVSIVAVTTTRTRHKIYITTMNELTTTMTHLFNIKSGIERIIERLDELQTRISLFAERHSSKSF
jgi:hypothetical protein